MEIEGKNGREMLDDRNYKLKQDKNTSAGAGLSPVFAGCGIKKADVGHSKRCSNN